MLPGMEATARTRPSASWPAALRTVRPEHAAAWLLAFAPTVYLALSGGGYDIVERSQIGLLLWWIVLLGAVVGVLPRRRLSGPAWVAVALLAAFLALTWVAAGWSQSEERTLVEAGRVSAYLAVLVAGLCLLTRRGARWLLYGLASAIAVVCALAVLSKLIPSWFPADSTANLYATTRLRYPFDYSDGVGEFAALGVPLLLFVAVGARTLVGRALGAAGLPAVALCVAMTVSRGGILAVAVGAVFFLALVTDTLRSLLTLAIAAAASAIELAVLLGHPGLRDQLVAAAPAGDRHTMLIVLILACLGAGLAQAGALLLLGRLDRAGRSRFGWAGSAFRGAIVAAVVIALSVVVATGEASHLWHQFKEPNPPRVHNQYLRLLSIAGSHRYQYWQVASAAFNAHPWKGIGPGTFEFYWAQHQHLGEFVRNAHSLWMETLAELGIPGLALIGGLFTFAVIGGCARALGADPRRRLLLASATAGLAAFCAAAAFDWVWQLGAIPFVAMLLVAVALGARDPRGRRREGDGRRRLGGALARLALVAIALPALWAIIRPLATTAEVRSSQSAAQRGDYGAALSDALTAQRLEPGAASPRLQRALLLEQLGDVGGAAAAIAQAAAREPTDWRIWLVASRIATERDRPREALADYRRARSLNPTSPIFR